MKRRWNRFIHGETCLGCGKVRRLRWYFDTGCCSHSCLNLALFRIKSKTYTWDDVRRIRDELP